MHDAKREWQTYCTTELEKLQPLLAERGYTLESEQPHIAGERYLMQAVTTASGRKLILFAVKDGTRVVIKATRDTDGIKELKHEDTCRQVLQKIDFASEVFHTPPIIDTFEKKGFFVIITRFISQEVSFLERPLKDQFMLALRGFKGQESAHATTFKHRRLISSTFGMRDAHTYLFLFEDFAKKIGETYQDETLTRQLNTAHTMLKANQRTIEQYTGFLTHTDFVPHNFRVKNDTIILLDHSSLIFGNKYEGWARFLNFMTLYNQQLEHALVQYVKDNRTSEESVSLRMMRIYRLGEIIWYYTRTLPSSQDNLLALNTARVHFWSDVLGYILEDKEVPKSRIHDYTNLRDSLRSEDEKRRQKGLH